MLSVLLAHLYCHKDFAFRHALSKAVYNMVLGLHDSLLMTAGVIFLWEYMYHSVFMRDMLVVYAVFVVTRPLIKVRVPHKRLPVYVNTELSESICEALSTSGAVPKNLTKAGPAQLIREHLHDVPGCKRWRIKRPSNLHCTSQTQVGKLAGSVTASGAHAYLCRRSFYVKDLRNPLLTMVHELVHDYTTDEGVAVYVTACLLQYSSDRQAYLEALSQLYKAAMILEGDGELNKYQEAVLHIPNGYKFSPVYIDKEA